MSADGERPRVHAAPRERLLKRGLQELDVGTVVAEDEVPVSSLRESGANTR